MLPVMSRKKKKKKKQREERPAESAGTGTHPRPLDSAYPSGEERVDGRRRTGGVRRRQGAGFDPSGPHVGQELVGDFSEHLLRQTSHAEDVVPSSVNVVSERNEL